MHGTGSSSFIKSHRVFCAGLASLAVAFTSLALADDGLLTKAEVEALAVGKTLRYTRASDGTTVAFDIREGGKVFYSPPRTQRNLSIQGSWTIADEGRLCFKWEADKFVTMQDGCYRFRRTGAKTQVVGGRDPDRVVGDVVE